MQKLSFYLVPNRLLVTTDLTYNGYTTENRQVYQRKLKLYKGIDNTIELDVRASDQRRLSVVGHTAVIKFYDISRNKLFSVIGDPVFSKTGIMTVTIAKEVLENIDPQQLTLAAYLRDTNNAETILYADSQFGVEATVELYNGYNDANNVVDVVKTWVYDMGSKELVSEIVDFKKKLNRNVSAEPGTDPTGTQADASSTIVVTPNEQAPYAGNITIEGTDDKSLAIGNRWTQIGVITPAEFSGKQLLGDWRFVRFRYPGNQYPGQGASFHVTKENGVYTRVEVVNRGNTYRIGDLILIKGSFLGGDDSVNDLTITVLTVNDNPPGALNTVGGLSFTGTASSGNGYYRAVKSELLSNVNTIDKITIID